MNKKNSINKKNQKEMTIKSQTQIEGTMTFIETDNKMHLIDFVNDEDAMMTPATFVGKVQVMRDGNVYITEKKKGLTVSLPFSGSPSFVWQL